MKISIVTSYFLPVPPARGGAMEKTWWALGKAWAAMGHEITLVCRAWPGMPTEETRDGVRFLRLRGRDLSRRFHQNILADFSWSRRVLAALPAGDFVISNSPFLPLWFRGRARKSGRVVPVIARMPKGQLRLYRQVPLMLVLSKAVRERVCAQSPALAAVTVLFPLPIDLGQLAGTGARSRSPKIRLGYIGRLHPEKGLELLLKAIVRLEKATGLPDWELLIAGPVNVCEGGGGEAWWQPICAQFQRLLGNRFHLLEPQFDAAALAELYRSIEIFCYPSVAEQGETFGAAVAEAMAAGCTPVVSALSCFRDLVTDHVTGRNFDHTAVTASQNLCTVLEELLRDAPSRARLTAGARACVAELDYTSAAVRLETILREKLKTMTEKAPC